MEERRKFPRLTYNVAVAWKKIERRAENDSEVTNVTKNISGGGICLQVDSSVKPQDVLEFQITLPTKKMIDSKGVVRWIEDFGIIGEKSKSRYEAGIEFININDKDREEIKQFVFSILKAKQ